MAQLFPSKTKARWLQAFRRVESSVAAPVLPPLPATVTRLFEPAESISTTKAPLGEPSLFVDFRLAKSLSQ